MRGRPDPSAVAVAIICILVVAAALGVLAGLIAANLTT